MKHLFTRWTGVCAALLLWTAAAHAADEQHHILWSLQGKTNKVYLLGSVHLLKEGEKLPAAVDSAYADAEKLVMEIDMDSAPWRDEFYTSVPAIDNGDFILPTGPGWGIDVNEKAVRARPPNT